MELSAVHDNFDDIPEQYQELYSEKNGKYELTGIRGVKTQADIERLQGALDKEKNDHKSVRERLGTWGELDYEDVMSKLDRIPELEAAAEGKLDDAAIDDLATKRAEATVRTRLAPVERDNGKLKKDNEELRKENKALRQDKTLRIINDNLDAAMVEAKVIDSARPDVRMYGERIFEIGDDGKTVFTKDGVGVTPGLTAKDWLAEMQDKRQHWWPASQGGGARGNDGRGMIMGGKNPWSHGAWNMTEQGHFLRTHGPEKAARAAELAGTTIGGPRPKG